MEKLIAVRVPNSPRVTLERINGKVVRLMTLNSLSKYVRLKSHTLRQWERKGILPKTIVMNKFNSGLGMECNRRFYTLEQADLLKKWVERVGPSKGRHINDSMIGLLHERWGEVTKAFYEEYGNPNG